MAIAHYLVWLTYKELIWPQKNSHHWQVKLNHTLKSDKLIVNVKTANYCMWQRSFKFLFLKDILTPFFFWRWVIFAGLLYTWAQLNSKAKKNSLIHHKIFTHILGQYTGWNSISKSYRTKAAVYKCKILWEKKNPLHFLLPWWQRFDESHQMACQAHSRTPFHALCHACWAASYTPQHTLDTHSTPQIPTAHPRHPQHTPDTPTVLCTATPFVLSTHPANVFSSLGNENITHSQALLVCKRNSANGMRVM